MYNLINIIDNNGVNFVKSVKDLYINVGMNKGNWSTWHKRNILNNVFFKEDVDYEICSTVVEFNETTDYTCTLDMAEHLVMQMPTEKAHTYRQYLIDIKNAWNTPEQVMARALQISQKVINNFQLKIEEMQPKVDFYDEIVDSKDTIGVAELAKTLNIKGIGRNNLFEFLRNKKILNNKNIPYQSYVDRGYFRTIETTYNKSGTVKIYIKTVVFQKGVDFVRKLLKENLKQD